MGGAAISKPPVIASKYVDDSKEEGNTQLSDAAGSTDGESHPSREEIEAVAMAVHLMPVFYVHDACMDDSEFTAVRNSWFLLVEDRCENFEQLGIADCTVTRAINRACY